MAAVSSLGSLSNDDGNSNEDITRKYIFISFVLLRNYFNSLNFYKNGELSRSQIGRRGMQVKKENEKLTNCAIMSPQNLKCGHFMLLFCRGRQRNVLKCKTHVRSEFFLLIKPIVLQRCRCRCHRRCLSSLLSLFHNLPVNILSWDRLPSSKINAYKGIRLMAQSFVWGIYLKWDIILCSPYKLEITGNVS